MGQGASTVLSYCTVHGRKSVLLPYEARRFCDVFLDWDAELQREARLMPCWSSSGQSRKGLSVVDCAGGRTASSTKDVCMYVVS